MAVGVTQSPPEMGGALPEGPIYRLSIEQYHEMIRAGILTDDDPVEFLEGYLATKMPKNPLHRAVTRRVREALERLAPAGWYVDTQEPITLSGSEPEPDVMIVRGSSQDYTERHPGPPDLAMVVEVADTTLQRDRTTKAGIYARAGIPIYWIVNLVERRVEVHADPTGPAETPAYRHREDFGPGLEIAVVVEGREVGRIAVADLLP